MKCWKTDPEEFQQRLWAMFNYQFPQSLTLPQIDRMRAHLFPEIRIQAVNNDLFAPQEQPAQPVTAIPDIIKVMDMQQELLARVLVKAIEWYTGWQAQVKP